MKFYGNGSVWNSEKGCMLCDFVNGVCETNDKYTIDKLIKLGYENGEKTFNLPESMYKVLDIDKMEYNELKKYCGELGYKGSMKKEELIKFAKGE